MKGYVLSYVFLVSSFAWSAVAVKSHQSDCLGELTDDPDRIEVTVEDCTLVVRHLNVVVNCCLEYKPKVETDGSTIRITEVDVGPPCDCICPFDLEITVEGLEPGRYTIVLKAFLHEEPLTYTVEIPPCEGFWLLGAEIWSTMGVMGVVMPVSATNPKPIEGFSFGTTWPLEHARMAEMNLEGTVTEEVGAEFTNFDIHNEDTPDRRGWATCAVILDWKEPFQRQTIPPGAGQRIVNLVYDILPPSGSVPRSISVPFVDGLGDPPVKIVFSVGGQDVVPEIRNGQIQISMPPPEFVRGDANDNGALSISDPIFLLSYLFAGGTEPPCEDAADANDDGILDLSDPVSILGYLFMGGEIPPPSPPGPPGPDPTLDPLGCTRG